MLIKVLSSVASFFSNTRYKAVFIPCLVVALALTGLTTVAVLHEGGTKSPSASANRSESDKRQTPSAKSPQVSGGDTQTFDDNQPVASEPVAPDTTPTPAPSDNQNTASAPTAAQLEMNLSAATVSIKADTTSSILTASVGSSNGPITWTTSLESQESGVSVALEPIREGSTDLQFRIRTGSTVAPGTHQLTITAKDTVRNLTVSKTLSITVTQ